MLVEGRVANNDRSAGEADHQVGIAMISGQHTSRGTPWDGAKLTSFGTADVTGGHGEQRGYFHNTHTDGVVSHGTFVAKVSAPAGRSQGVGGLWSSATLPGRVEDQAAIWQDEGGNIDCA